MEGNNNKRILGTQVAETAITGPIHNPVKPHPKPNNIEPVYNLPLDSGELSHEGLYLSFKI